MHFVSFDIIFLLANHFSPTHRSLRDKTKNLPLLKQNEVSTCKEICKEIYIFLANKLRRITPLRNVNRKKQSSSRKTIRKQNSFVTLTEFISR